MAEPQGSAFASNDFEAVANHKLHTATELSLLKHQQKLSARAERKFSATKHDFSICAKELRAFLRLEEERLRVADRLGARGQWIAKGRSFAVDLVVHHAFRHALVSADSASETEGSSGLAIVALGGYGRSELAPFSDLDLLFLTTDRPSGQVATVVERCQHLLWDAGITLGQKSSGVGSCIPAARTDPHFQTALVNARFIAGDTTVFRQLTAALDREREKNSAFLPETTRRERDQRYEQRGTVIYLQEPNVKEGAGGLRDLHSAIWAAYAQSGLKTLEQLTAHGFVAADQCQGVVNSYDFLLRVRHQAHWITGRKTDRLALDLQETIARKLGYDSTGHFSASEKFMRDYYRHARVLHQFSDSLFRNSIERMQSGRRWFTAPRRKRIDPLFSLKDNQLYFDGSLELLAEKPKLLFRATALAQANHVVLSQDLCAMIRTSLAAIDRRFRNSAEAAEAFLSLLRRPAEAGRALRLMHEVGLLGRYLPEFERIHMLIQQDLYHQFTVDEHTFQTIEALDSLHRSSDRKLARFRIVLDQLQDHSLLYLSLLLHDLGKTGRRGHIPRGARIAQQICSRLHLDEVSTQKVVTLVKHHVLMAHLSQRRDLREPRLAQQFAHQVGNLDVLNMLFLLTYADLNGVGPAVWSDWKGDLLEELYMRTRAVLTGEATTSARSEKQNRLKTRVIESLAEKYPISETERHFALVPQRYVETTSADDIELHLHLISKLEGNSLACCWRDREDFATELTICTRDRHGLFADAAGALAATGVDILSADVNTREDGIAIDSFVLRQAATRRAVDRHRWGAIERALRAAISKEYEVAPLVERWRTRHAPRKTHGAFTTHRAGQVNVACDNEAAETTTLIEVRAPDEHGLAYQIARGLTNFGLDIACARIATEKSDALDVFYVTQADGSKLSETQIQQLTLSLTETLSERGRGYQAVAS